MKASPTCSHGQALEVVSLHHRPSLTTVVFLWPVETGVAVRKVFLLTTIFVAWLAITLLSFYLLPAASLGQITPSAVDNRTTALRQSVKGKSADEAFTSRGGANGTNPSRLPYRSKVIAAAGPLSSQEWKLLNWEAITGSETGTSGSLVGAEEAGMSLLIFFPRSLAEIQQLRGNLESYLTRHPVLLCVLFSNLYLFLQTFAIPGTMSVLNILAGSLFGFVPGLTITVFLMVIAAIASYALAAVFLRDVAHACFPAHCDWMKEEVSKNRDSLFNYLLFLRLMPVTPSIVVNLCAPVVGIPLRPYIIATFIGFLPITAVQVRCQEVGGTVGVSICPKCKSFFRKTLL